MRIAFIGGGHMTTSLIGGLRSGGMPAGDITVADPVAGQLERLRQEFGVQGTHDNAAAAGGADVIVLAVKPQDMATAARSLAAVAGDGRRVVLSIAAGIRLANLATWLGQVVNGENAAKRVPAEF